MRPILATAALAAILPLSATAFEMTGATVGLSYGQLTDETDLDRVDLGGAVEFGFSQNFAVQADLGFAQFGASDLDLTSLALHGIWHASDVSSLGLFLGRDTAEIGPDDASQSFLGIEVGYGEGGFDAEAFFAVADTDGGNGTAAGVTLDWGITPVIGLGLTVDRLSGDDIDLTALALRGSYDVTPQAELYAEVGTMDVDVGGLSADSTFIGIGAEVNFGAARGATFDRRSLLGAIPGL
jgi:hypothetical protein